MKTRPVLALGLVLLGSPGWAGEFDTVRAGWEQKILDLSKNCPPDCPAIMGEPNHPVWVRRSWKGPVTSRTSWYQITTRLDGEDREDICERGVEYSDRPNKPLWIPIACGRLWNKLGHGVPMEAGR